MIDNQTGIVLRNDFRQLNIKEKTSRIIDDLRAVVQCPLGNIRPVGIYRDRSA